MKISNVTTWKSPPAEAQCEIPQQLLNFADSAIILSGFPNHLYILWSN